MFLVEDDHDTRVTLRAILESEGYTVFSAADGCAALEALEKMKAPDLILLDMMLPVMDGLKFLETKRRNPTLARVPVLVMSAFPEKMLQARAKIFLTKPLDLGLLLRTMRAIAEDEVLRSVACA